MGILKSPSDDLFTQIFYSPSGAELLTSSSSGTVKVARHNIVEIDFNFHSTSEFDDLFDVY